MRGIKTERKSICDELRAFREQDILDVTVPQGQNREYTKYTFSMFGGDPETVTIRSCKWQLFSSHLPKAINLNAQITFKYFSYDAKKQKQYMRKGELYTASPWTMIYADDNYYLLAYEKGTFKHFRVDKMDNVTPCVETFELTGEEVVTLPREGKEEFEKVDMSAYSHKRNICLVSVSAEPDNCFLNN